MRARSLSILAAISLASVTSFGTAHAAYDHERNGFFIGFGLGGGSDEEKYKGLDDDSGGGGVGNFRIGGALNRTFALGLETTGFTRQTDIAGGGTLQRNATVAALAATVFPTRGGYYLRGGVGFARVSAEYRDAGLTLSGDEGGLGVLFATGYEFRLTPKFALAPQFEVAGAAIDGDVVDTVSWWGLSAQLNWWW